MSCTFFEYQPTSDDLCQLREWIGKTPYIVQDYEDKFLEAIIRKCKGSLQKTKAIIENINSLGMRYPELFGHLDIFNKKTKEYLDVVQVFIVPQWLEDNSFLVILKLNLEKMDPYKYSLYEGHRHLLMSIYVLIWENLFGSGTATLIFDWKNINPVHVREATPVYLKKSAEIRGENYPVRIKAIHHINVPPLLQWIVNVLHSFMKTKLLERIHIHKSLESLHASVPIKLLPKEFGGNQESCEILHDRWRKKVESYRDRLVAENEKMRSLDPLRPKSNNIHDMVGTFRALKVD